MDGRWPEIADRAVRLAKEDAVGPISRDCYPSGTLAISAAGLLCRQRRASSVMDLHADHRLHLRLDWAEQRPSVIILSLSAAQMFIGAARAVDPDWAHQLQISIKTPTERERLSFLNHSLAILRYL